MAKLTTTSPARSLVTTSYSFTNFFEFWDKFVDDAMKHTLSAPQFIVTTKGISIKNPYYYVPEPYYGDPKNCSAVILNINPGAGGPSHVNLFPNGEATYSKHAREFPYLNSSISSFNPAGDKWWEKRKEWLDRLVKSYIHTHPEIANVDKAKDFPFAIEFCPWHSDKIVHINQVEKATGCSLFLTPEQLLDYVLIPASEAAKGTPCNIIFAVLGQSFFHSHLSSYYEPFEIWEPDSTIGKWKSKLGSLPSPSCPPYNIKRSYALYKPKEKYKNILRPILTTWGGRNKSPKAVFENVEQEILGILKTNGII